MSIPNQNEISYSGKDLQDRDTSIDGDNIVRDTEDESDVTEDSDDSDSDGDFGAYIVPLGGDAHSPSIRGDCERHVVENNTNNSHIEVREDVDNTENTEVNTDGAVDVDDSSTDDEDVVNVDDINNDIEDTVNDDDAVTNDGRSEDRDEDETDVKNFRNIELYVPTQIVSTDEHEVDLQQVNDTGCANSDTVESNSEIDDNCNRPVPQPRRLRKPPDRFKDFYLYQMVEDRSIDRRLSALDNLFKSGVLSRIDNDIAHTIICNIMK
ncbi:hypothetical protein ACF0H5_018753 [Mactra antiquata]